MQRFLANRDIAGELSGLIGVPYCEKGWSVHTGFGCWPFVHYVFHLRGVDLPVDVFKASGLFEKVEEPYQALDVIYFRLKPFIEDHVGVFVNSFELMHCSEAQNGVCRVSKSHEWVKLAKQGVYRMKKI